LKADTGPGQRELRIHSCGDPQSVTCGCGVIERVEQYKYLGVIIDKKLSWEPHIQYVNKKIRSMIYAFRQLREVLTVDHCRRVYYAYIQSTLQYGILAWGGASTSVLEPLFVTQKSIIKIINRLNLRFPSELLFVNFRVLSIRQLFIKNLLIYIKENKDHIFSESTHQYNTRSKLNFGYDIPKLNYRVEIFNSFYIAHQLYRNLPNEIIVAEGGSVATYRRGVEEWLLRIGVAAADELTKSPYA